MRPHKRRPHGFTLIELIIVVIVIGIMAAVLAPLAVSSLRAYDAVLGDVVVLDKLRYATERLAREIREVDYVAPPPTGTGTGFGFTSMGNNSMAFTRSTGMPSPNTTVTVGNTGTSVTLNYSSGGGTQMLTDELGGISGTPSSNLLFEYLDQNGDVLASPTTTTVYSVRISLTLRHNSQDYTQRTQVELKNRS